MVDSIEMGFPTQASIPPYCGVGVGLSAEPEGALVTIVSRDSTLFGRVRAGVLIEALRETGTLAWIGLQDMGPTQMSNLFRGAGGTQVDLRVREGASVRVERGLRLPFEFFTDPQTGKDDIRLVPGGTPQCEMNLSALGTLLPQYAAMQREGRKERSHG